MLKKLRLHNFRTFLNAELTFTQRHLVIGRNNSGKTNLCSALFFLRSTAINDLATAAAMVPGGMVELKNWAFNSPEIRLSCTCALPFAGEVLDFTYDLTLRVEAPPSPMESWRVSLRLAAERLTIDGPGFPSVVLLENDGREAQMLHEEDSAIRGDNHTVKTLAPNDATMLSRLYEAATNRRAILFRKYLSSLSYHAFSPEHIRFAWQTSLPPLLGLIGRGDNLATVLYQMKNMDEQRYRRVVEHVRIVEPTLEAVNFFPVPNQTPVPLVALRGQPRASWQGLSDGTLRCLGLAFIIEAAAGFSSDTGLPPPLVVIEEPENGIYPGQLRNIFDLFEERAPQVQFILTSHNPYFINFFDGFRESVTILRRTNGTTEIISPPPASDDPDRLMLAEQYALELIG
ncbi:MAG: AAA family ATPase [Planctomycetota bacterium]